jgi:hypothetical protein
MTKPPSAEDLRVALDTLTTDSTRWDECAGILGEASVAADTLALREADFGLAFLVHSAYTEIQQWVTDLLGGGSRACTDVADALITARDTYRREEDANVHRIKEIW